MRSNFHFYIYSCVFQVLSEDFHLIKIDKPLDATSKYNSLLVKSDFYIITSNFYLSK